MSSVCPCLRVSNSTGNEQMRSAALGEAPADMMSLRCALRAAARSSMAATAGEVPGRSRMPSLYSTIASPTSRPAVAQANPAPVASGPAPLGGR